MKLSRLPDSLSTALAVVCFASTFGGGALAAGALDQQPQNAKPLVVPLWKGGPAESKGLPSNEMVEDHNSNGGVPNRRYWNITQPELEVFRADKPNGTGILILPGGGYAGEMMDKEGREIARWFNSIGVSGFVLKYRLPNTKTHRFGAEIPLEDACRAMRLIRSNAGGYDIQTNRIGVIGFSAGGHLASTLATHYDLGRAESSDSVERLSCRPDFVVLGYPVISMEKKITHTGSRRELLGANPSEEMVRRFSNELHVNSNTPPVFIFCASDDTVVNPVNSERFYNAARTAGVPAELHIFEVGGHGFGLRPNSRAGTTWPGLCESWLRERGFLK